MHNFVSRNPDLCTLLCESSFVKQLVKDCPRPLCGHKDSYVFGRLDTTSMATAPPYFSAALSSEKDRIPYPPYV